MFKKTSAVSGISARTKLSRPMVWSQSTRMLTAERIDCVSRLLQGASILRTAISVSSSAQATALLRISRSPKVSRGAAGLSAGRFIRFSRRKKRARLALPSARFFFSGCVSGGCRPVRILSCSPFVIITPPAFIVCAHVPRHVSHTARRFGP